MYKPMLAKKLQDNMSSVIFPGYVQPKLDGVRCQLTLDGFFSRNGKKLSGVPRLEKETMKLFCCIPLDGELYSQHLSFQEIISCVRRSTCINENPLVEYHVFDIALHNRLFIDRHLYLTNLFWKSESDRDPRIVLVNTRKVAKLEELEVLMALYTEQGYEGLMYRYPRSPYEFGKRSKYLLKYKKMKTEDVICIGYKEGKGKHLGMLGALECVGEDGSKIWVGSGFTDDQRQNYFDDIAMVLGCTLTIKYQEKTDGGISRFPVFVCWRDYE